MKNFRRLAIVTLALLLGILPMFAAGAVAETTFKKGEWVVVEPDAVLYRDAALTKSWARAPYYLMVKLAAVRGNVGAIRSGNRVGYISLERVTHVQEGDSIISARKTRVYQKPSLKSRHVNIGRNLRVEVVAIKGDCAMVTRNGVTGYVYMKHFEFVPASRQ